MDLQHPKRWTIEDPPLRIWVLFHSTTLPPSGDRILHRMRGRKQEDAAKTSKTCCKMDVFRLDRLQDLQGHRPHSGLTWKAGRFRTSVWVVDRDDQWNRPLRDGLYALYEPLDKRHLGGCAIYSETTVTCSSANVGLL